MSVAYDPKRLLDAGEVTYWPITGQVFAGKHLHELPKFLDPIAVITPDNRLQTTSPQMSAAMKFARENQNKDLATALVTATDFGANAENLMPLQLIQLIREAQAPPEDIFFLENMFLKRDTPNLELRETVRSVGSTARRTGRMERTRDTRVTYAEYKHDVGKITADINVPIEDTLRTVINPKTVEVENMYHDIRLTRNLEAWNAIKKTTWDITGASGSEDLGNISGIATNGFHSDNRFSTKLQKAFSIFLKQHRVSISHVCMNPISYAYYTENTWTRQGPVKIDPERPPKGGVKDLPGIEGVTAVLDMEVPEGEMYAFSKRWGLRVGEGPKYMRTDYDKSIHSETSSYLDFVDFLNVDDKVDHDKIGGRRFSFKITFNSPT